MRQVNVVVVAAVMLLNEHRDIDRGQEREIVQTVADTDGNEVRTPVRTILAKQPPDGFTFTGPSQKMKEPAAPRAL